MLPRNRIFPALFPPEPAMDGAGRLSVQGARRPVRAETWLDIRWERVRALRTAIAEGRYDLDARIDDLLDDPPEELAGWIADCAG